VSSSALPPTTKRSLLRRIFTTDHRVIGLQYGAVALAAVGIGTVLSLLMRLHLAWPNLTIPGWGLIKPEDYLALVTMHGTLMVFFVLTVAPQSTFGNLFLPAQIGAREMSLPWLNAVGLWGTVLSLLVLLAAFFVPLGAPIGGWSAYPPLSAIASAGPGQGWGMDCWLASIAIFCVASSCGSVNFLTTVSRERCRGMSVGRMPLTVWSWWVSAMLILLSFTVLLAALLLLFCDRHLGTHFFVPSGLVVNGFPLPGSGDGSPLLWQHLFWFFGHPEVYIAILPAMGLTSSLLANFTRRRLASYHWMVFTTLAIAFLGIVVWGHHMFVSGMNPYAGSAFALTTMAIALPSSAKVLAWLRMLWNSRSPRRDWFQLPMLFTLGFLSFFIAGGLTGPLLAQPMLDSYLHNTYFVLGHFHLIMGMAAVFGIFAATYYWFPLMTGRRMNVPLGQAHFWLSVTGAYGTFLPMHLAGLAGLPRHYAQLGGSQAAFLALQPLQRGITFSALLLISAQLLFLVNLALSWRCGALSGENPWGATTLEWAPPAWFDDPKRAIVTGPYEYGGVSGSRRPAGSANIRGNEGLIHPQWMSSTEAASLPAQQE
jgi:cytochrome c oxidase subunit 1